MFCHFVLLIQRQVLCFLAAGFVVNVLAVLLTVQDTDTQVCPLLLMQLLLLRDQLVLQLLDQRLLLLSGALAATFATAFTITGGTQPVCDTLLDAKELGVLESLVGANSV